MKHTVRKGISVLLFLLLWEVLVKANVMTPLMFGNLPAPTDVLKTFAKVLADGTFYYHIGASLGRIVVGSFLALPVAVFLGVLIGRARWAEDFILPMLEALRPIPQISWIPVAILLFPSIEGSIIFITFLGAFFPILVNTIEGIRGVSPSYITAAFSMGATRRQMLTKVYLPAAVPHIMTGFSVGVGVSWMSVIAAEMISGKYGIGYYTWTSYTLMAYSETIVGMITIGVLGLVCFAGISRVKKYLLRWRGEEEHA